MDGYACCVFMFRQTLWILRNNATEIQCPHYILSGFTRYPHKKIGDVSLGHLVKVLFARFLHYKITVFPFLCYLESLSQACIQEERSNHIYYLKFCKLCLTLFICLYCIHVSMDFCYLFIFVLSNTILFSFLKFFHIWPFGALRVCHLSLFDMPPLFCFLSTSLFLPSFIEV